MAVADAQVRPARRTIPRPSARHVLVVVLAVAAGVANVMLLRAADAPTTVVVAAVDIAAGTRIGAGDLVTAEVVADPDLTSRLTIDPAPVVGQVATRNLVAGDPLLAGDAVAATDMRAMSIPVTVDVAVGGTLVPGDRVDAISVIDGVASYVATGLAVLAVPADDGLGGIDFAPTVAIDEATALAIAEALAVGDLHLVRSTGVGDG